MTKKKKKPGTLSALTPHGQLSHLRIRHKQLSHRPHRETNVDFTGQRKKGEAGRSAKRGKPNSAGARTVHDLMTRVRLAKPARSQDSQSRMRASHGHFDTGQDDCQVREADPAGRS